MSEKSLPGSGYCDSLVESCTIKNDDTMLGCTPGNGGCGNYAELLEAEESPFHNEHLVRATKQINEILSAIPENGSSKLTFIHLKEGTLLAWVQHGGEPTAGGIRWDEEPELFREKLKLI